jgi:hypothetical protein
LFLKPLDLQGFLLGFGPGGSPYKNGWLGLESPHFAGFEALLAVWVCIGCAFVLQVYCSGGSILLQGGRRFGADNWWFICVCLPKCHGFSALVLGLGA